MRKEEAKEARGSLDGLDRALVPMRSARQAVQGLGISEPKLGAPFFKLFWLLPKAQQAENVGEMHRLLCCLLLCFAALVQSLSSTGNRLLVVIEDPTERDKYSQFWDDLRSK